MRFRTKLVDIERERPAAGAITAIVVEGGAGGLDPLSRKRPEADRAASRQESARSERIPCDQLILACGHSARDVFELLRERAPWCRVVVGGAVLTPEYAQMVGADFYAKDATETARIAGEVLGR